MVELVQLTAEPWRSIVGSCCRRTRWPGSTRRRWQPGSWSRQSERAAAVRPYDKLLWQLIAAEWSFSSSRSYVLWSPAASCSRSSIFDSFAPIVVCPHSRKTSRLNYCEWNEWLFYSSTQIQYGKNSKEENRVDWTEGLKKHLRLPYKIGKWRNTLHYKIKHYKTTHALNSTYLFK